MGGDSSNDSSCDLRKDVGRRLAPGDSAFDCVRESDGGIKVRARDGAKGKNQGNKCSASCQRVREQGDGGVAAGELLRHDARADYRSEEKGSANSLRCQSAGKRRGLVSFCCLFTWAQKERLSSEISRKYNRASEYTEPCQKRKLI